MKKDARDWAGIHPEKWTDAELFACARWWADKLGLCAWRVGAVFAPLHQLDGALARTQVNAPYEYAEMRVAMYPDRDKEDPDEMDVEGDVVHELLHARLFAFDGAPAGDEMRHHAQEFAIERLARALVYLRRGQK